MPDDAAFADRHIGPGADAQARDARRARLRRRSTRSIDAAVPGAIRDRDAARRSARRRRGARCSSGCARSRDAQRGVHVADRPRLPRHDHAARDPAQRAREPGVVHGVHAVPARDLAGPARGAAQLPDDGHRPHRRWISPTRRCSTKAPRRPRRWRCCTGSTRRPATRSSSTPTAIRRRSRSCAPAPSRSASSRGRRPARRAPGRRRVRRAAAVPGQRAGAVRDDRAIVEPRTTRGALVAVAADLLALHAARRRPARSAPTSSSAARSASACRSASAARTPRSSRHATSTSARCPAAWSACRSTGRAAPRSGSRCRRASSTSGARRRRATSAPRRCCSR